MIPIVDHLKYKFRAMLLDKNMQRWLVRRFERNPKDPNHKQWVHETDVWGAENEKEAIEMAVKQDDWR